MDEVEFNTELAKLLNEERKKEPYYLESIDAEIGIISSAFYDHYASLMSLQSIATVDDLLLEIEQQAATDARNEDEEDFEPEAQDPMLVALNDLLQMDIEKIDAFEGGEIRVDGHGLFAYEPGWLDEASVEVMDENGIGLLEEGQSITGDFKRFAVGQVITFGTYLQTQQDFEDEELEDDEDEEAIDPASMEMPGVWLVLGDVQVIDENGMTQRTLPEVLVPISYQTLHFNKVIRRNALDTPKSEEDVTQPSIGVYFKGGFIMDTCNEIENDLNFNDHDEEELRVRREHYQEQLAVYMSMVEEGVLTVSAFNAIFLNGDEKQLEDQDAHYFQPVIMKIDKIWRVVHVFGITTDEGPLLAHILPEHLHSIAKKAGK